MTEKKKKGLVTKLADGLTRLGRWELKKLKQMGNAYQADIDRRKVVQTEVKQAEDTAYKEEAIKCAKIRGQRKAQADFGKGTDKRGDVPFANFSLADHVFGKTPEKKDKENA